MRNIIYYVAASIDGFIAGSNGDISKFVAEGSGVEQYLHDLQVFDTVIMGRHTYEFGYHYGLQPGQPAYPNMRHYIFSNTLHLETLSNQVHLCKLDPEFIHTLKAEAGTDIYLCGGGQFAGWLLDHGLIDRLKIKLNPFVAGDGIRLFGDSKRTVSMELEEAKVYENGLQILDYRLAY